MNTGDVSTMTVNNNTVIQGNTKLITIVEVENNGDCFCVSSNISTSGAYTLSVCNVGPNVSDTSITIIVISIGLF